MKKIKIGITGRNGFLGRHLFNNLKLWPEEFEIIPFEREFFHQRNALDNFVSQCDTIVHLAALNRHESDQVLYETNTTLSQLLKDALQRTNSRPHVIISSSTQEESDNLYGKSKRKARQLLGEWANENDAKFSGLIIPNIFGPFGRPFYNSFIATFCYQLNHGEEPKIQTDGEVKLLYVQELVVQIIEEIRNKRSHPKLYVNPTASKKVSEVLELLKYYKSSYFQRGEIPVLANSFELNLFNTYRSYIDYKTYFPKKFDQHIDSRGAFVEIIRLGVGGQCSFSTTVPGIIRGNHYHIRKIERFAVIKGEALIQLRRVDSDETLNFKLDGKEPAYVDMPIWYTHNIKNTGNEDLYTIFWINEPYNPEDTDTYFTEV